MSLARQLLLSLGVIALMLAASAWAWPRLPEVVAVHFGADGAANGWAPKLQAVLLLPALAAGITLLQALLYRFTGAAGPRQSGRAFGAVWSGVLLLLAGVHGLLLAKALNQGLEMVNLIAVLLGVFFLVLGNYAGKIRHNFVFGVRTPWTLADPRVWDKTHRLFGWTTVLAGLVLIAAALALREGGQLTGVLVGAGVAPSVIATVYSWWISGRPGLGPDRSAEGRG